MIAFHLCFALDIVEGMVNKGIFLNGDNGGTFLHFGNYQNSCISDPTLCGPEGECAVIYAFHYLQTLSVQLQVTSLSFSRDYFFLFLEKP